MCTYVCMYEFMYNYEPINNSCTFVVSFSIFINKVLGNKVFNLFADSGDFVTFVVVLCFHSFSPSLVLFIIFPLHFVFFLFLLQCQFHKFAVKKATLGRIGLWNKFGIENINSYVPISRFNTSSFIEITVFIKMYILWSAHVYGADHNIYITLRLSTSDYYQWWFSA